MSEPVQTPPPETDPDKALPPPPEYADPEHQQDDEA